MRSDIVKLAQRHFPPCTGTVGLSMDKAKVKDIISVILHADKNSRNQTRSFAGFLKGPDDVTTMRNIWKFVRKSIRYQRDKEGAEIVKTPGCTLADKFADCKSMALMAASLAHNLGYQYRYRVAFYDPAEPQQGHIYAIVTTPAGEDIVVDPVHHTFGVEVPYWKATDYNPETGKPSRATAISGPPPGTNTTVHWTTWIMVLAAGLTILNYASHD